MKRSIIPLAAARALPSALHAQVRAEREFVEWHVRPFLERGRQREPLSLAGRDPNPSDTVPSMPRVRAVAREAFDQADTTATGALVMAMTSTTTTGSPCMTTRSGGAASMNDRHVADVI